MVFTSPNTLFANTNGLCPYRRCTWLGTTTFEWMLFFILKDHFVPIAKNNSLLSDFTFCQKKDQYLTYFTLACYVTWSLWGSEVILFGLCMFKSRLLEETLILKMRTSSSLSEGGVGGRNTGADTSPQFYFTVFSPRSCSSQLKLR